jgi:O-acetyl-ADP-ribose deacetylase (regulator of RNase III)
MTLKNRLFLAYIICAEITLSLGAPVSEDKEEDAGLARQLLTSVLAGSFGVSTLAAGASGSALAAFSWQALLARGLFQMFKWMMKA